MIMLTKQLSKFIDSLRYSDVPDEVLDIARLGFIDCIGVMVAGSQEKATSLVSKSLVGNSAVACSPEVISGRLLQTRDAALVNGVSAHVLDFDDVALEGHPSAVLVPAIMAVGHAQNSSGIDMLKAYIAGYETWALINELDPGSYHDRGFHPTSICGTLAAAAVCAYLKNLSREKTEHAIAISASMASGLVANFGTMTKSLHVGLAAKNGVYSAELAESGYTASLDVLEHRTGFLSAHSSNVIDSETLRINYDLGADWKILQYGLNIKRYPVCYATHRSIDAILQLMDINRFTANDISRINVLIGTVQNLMLRNNQPQNALEAKFSIQFALASAVISNQVGVAQLTDDFVQRHDVQSLMRKVKINTTDEKVQDWDQPYSPHDEVTVLLANGKEFFTKVYRPKGSWENKLSRDELYKKFYGCTSGLVDSDKLFNILWDMKGLSSAKEIALS